ncbi:speckle-type POZ protein-like isoform X2 [Dinothrombium tinctorium]|uniref:Speckle-type POZ protein-like isoform X2 n=1 Tax=Dinothrombium tinctorium TaxID=1965070 RepID=A0A3S3P8Z3_9ACAR|nr:speckle-type POZ protein-like isoform X2 [Dinothrombium tinctorium]
MKLILLSILFVGCLSNPTNHDAKEPNAFDNSPNVGSQNFVRNEDGNVASRYHWHDQNVNQPENVPKQYQPILPSVRQNQHLVWASPKFNSERIEQRKEEAPVMQPSKTSHQIPANAPVDLKPKEAKASKQVDPVESILPPVLNEKRRLGDEDQADVNSEPNSLVGRKVPQKPNTYVIAWPNGISPEFLSSNHFQVRSDKVDKRVPNVASAEAPVLIYSLPKRQDTASYTPVVFVSGSPSSAAPQVLHESVSSVIPQVQNIPQLNQGIVVPWANYGPNRYSFNVLHQNTPTQINHKENQEPVVIQNAASPVLAEIPQVYAVKETSASKKPVESSPQTEVKANTVVTLLPTLYGNQKNIHSSAISPSAITIPLVYQVPLPCDHDQKAMQSNPMPGYTMGYISNRQTIRQPIAILIPQSPVKTVTKFQQTTIPLKPVPMNYESQQPSQLMSSSIPWTVAYPGLYYAANVGGENVLNKQWQLSGNAGYSVIENTPSVSEIQDAVKPQISEVQNPKQTTLYAIFILNTNKGRFSHNAKQIKSPKQKIEERKLGKADKIGKSENLIKNTSFVWVIDNFEYWVWPGFNLRSPKFQVKRDDKNMDFSIRVSEGENGYLALAVALDETSEVDNLHVKTKVSLLGNDMNMLYNKTDYWFRRGVRLLSKEEPVSWPEYIKLDDLYKLLGKQKDLPIMVELQIPNPTHNATEPRGAKDYLRTKVAECQSFSDVGRKLYNDSKYCDLKFEFTKSPGQVLNGHRAIINIRAPKVLDSAGKKKKVETDDGTMHVIEVEDVDGDEFAEILEYIYTDIDPKNLSGRATDFYNMAKKYGLKHLLEVTENEIYRQVTVENAVELIKFAEAHDLKPLKKHVFEFIRENANLMSPENWEKLLNDLVKAMKCDIETVRNAIQNNEVELLSKAGIQVKET